MTKIEELETELWHEKALRGAWQEAARRVRNGTIEECAQVAQQWLIKAEQGSGEDLIDAIRAMKEERPCGS